MTSGAHHRAGATELRKLLGAILSIGADLDLRAVLQRVVETAVELVGARYGALGVVDPSGTHLVEFLTVGVDAETRRAIGAPPTGRGVLGRLLVDAEPLRLADVGRHPNVVGFPPGHPAMTTFLGVPIFVRGEVFGALYLADRHDETPDGVAEFTETDEELVSGLATAAAVAIDNARLHERSREVDLVEDRERIARDLHDTVIQRLFATGLSLEATLRLVDRPEVIERIQRTIDDLDETVRQIRFVIFGLNDLPALTRTDDVRAAIRSLVREFGDRLGFEPGVQLEGPLDAVLDAELRGHLLAVLREGLENVARHAGTAEAMVKVSARGGQLVVLVEDRGVGPASVRPVRGGLADLVDRAEALGGRATFSARPGGGASLHWAVPLAS